MSNVEQKDKLVYKLDNNTNKASFIAGLIMITLSIFLMFFNSIVCKIIGIIGVLVYVYGLIFLISRLLVKTEDIVIVDKNGITDNSSAISLGFISWEDIDEITTAYFGGDQFVHIQLKDDKKYLKKLSVFKKVFVLINKKMGLGIALISEGSTGIEPEVFIKEVKAYRKSLNV